MTSPTPCIEQLLGKASSRPPEPLSGGTAPAGDKGGSPWCGFGGLGSCKPRPWEGRGVPGLGGAGAYHIPPFGDCRIPTPSDAGAFSHLDRDSHLPGRSCPCRAICLWIPAPNCQAWDGVGPAQRSKSPTTVPSSCFWISGELWPTQKRGGVCSHWAHVASERELWTHTNVGLNPCSIIYLLCDPGQVIQHL